MSLKETSTLIAESRKIIEAGQDDSVSLLNMILQIVTNIDTRMKRMETNIDKRIDELKQSMLSVSARVRELETLTKDMKMKASECESSCNGVSNLFDKIEEQTKKVENQTKLNTRNLIQQDTRIKKLEEQPRVQTVVQPAVVSVEIESLKSKVLDLQCRSMKNNLVFSDLRSSKFENCENKLRDFIRHELRIDHYIEFGNVHRFGKPGRNGARPIVARFIYYNDLQCVLKNAYKLRGSQFGISEQFPAEIVARRQKLYPKMREAKQQRREVVLVRDRLYIDGEQYFPPEDRFLESEDNIINPTPPHESGKDEPSTRTNNVNNLATPGRKLAKRSRVGSSPPQTNSPVA